MRFEKVCAVGGQLGLVFLLLLLLLLGLNFTPPAVAAFKHLQEGMEAPSFALETLEGKKVAFEEYKGKKVVVVVFWASWSNRSLDELKDLQALREKYQNQGLEVLALNTENLKISPQEMERIKSEIAARKLTMPVLLDRGLEVYNTYGVVATPSTALVDKEGKVHFSLAGYNLMMKDQLEDMVRELLGLAVTKKVERKAGYVPPRAAMLNYNAGRNLYNLGQLDKAITYLTKAAEADPKFSAPHNLMGMIYLRQQQKEQATLVLKKAVELDAASVSAHANLGRAYYENKNYDLAQKELKEALRLDPNYTPAQAVLGLTLAAQGKGTEAEKIIKDALELSPRDSHLYYDLGQVYESQKTPQKALSAYKEGLKLLFD